MKIDRHIHCENCHYDLFGLEINVCPECGKAFIPEQLLYSNLLGSSAAKCRYRIGPLAGSLILILSFVIGGIAANFFPFQGRAVFPITIPILIGCVSTTLLGFGLMSWQCAIVTIIPIELLIVAIVAHYAGTVSWWWFGNANTNIILPWLIGSIVGKVGKVVYATRISK